MGRRQLKMNTSTSRADVRKHTIKGSVKPRRTARSTGREGGQSGDWGRGSPAATAEGRRHSAALTEPTGETPNKRPGISKRISPVIACTSTSYQNIPIPRFIGLNDRDFMVESLSLLILVDECNNLHQLTVSSTVESNFVAILVKDLHL